MSKEISAFKEGLLASEKDADGEGLTPCPYEMGDPKFHEWWGGYNSLYPDECEIDDGDEYDL